MQQFDLQPKALPFDVLDFFLLCRQVFRAWNPTYPNHELKIVEAELSWLVYIAWGQSKTTQTKFCFLIPKGSHDIWDLEKRLGELKLETVSMRLFV